MSRQELLARLDAMARARGAEAPIAAPLSTRPAPRPRPPRVDRIAEVSGQINAVQNERAVIARIARIEERAVEDRFRLGGLLCKLRDKRWYGGYPSFARLVERRFGLRKSTAYKAICVYEVLMDLCVDFAVIKDLGVAKLSLLCAKIASGELPRHDFVTRATSARAMSFRELAASFPRKRPPYLMRARPERKPQHVHTWMRLYGAEKILVWFAQAFPTWRAEDAAAVIARARNAGDVAGAGLNLEKAVETTETQRHRGTSWGY